MKAPVVYESAYGNTKRVAEAAVDTRARLFTLGDAAKKMTETLRAGRAEIVSKPMAFYVKGSEGPLRSGELEKAATWAGNLLKRAGR